MKLYYLLSLIFYLSAKDKKIKVYKKNRSTKDSETHPHQQEFEKNEKIAFLQNIIKLFSRSC